MGPYKLMLNRPQKQTARERVANTLKTIAAEKKYDCVGQLVSAFETGASYKIASKRVSIDTKKDKIKPNNGSCVYIGNQIVLTAAHCVYKEITDDKFLRDMHHHNYVTFNKGLANQAIHRVIAIKIDPQFEGVHNGIAPSEHDIAILYLEAEPTHIKPAKIDFEPFTERENAISIGYTDKMLIHSRNKSRQIVQITDKPVSKCASIVPKCFYSDHKVESVIGQTIESITRIPPDEYSYSVKKRKLLLHEWGLAPGMSGGGVFSKKRKIFAINSGIYRNLSQFPIPKPSTDTVKLFQSEYAISGMPGDILRFAALAENSWIKETIHFFKANGQQLMKQLPDWYEARKKYEEARDSKADTKTDSKTNGVFTTITTAATSALTTLTNGASISLGFFKNLYKMPDQISDKIRQNLTI
jgi:hypothetical protein